MAGGGRTKIKGGVASNQEALVIDGALVVTAVGGLGGGGAFQWNFFGEAPGTVTEVDMHGNNDAVPLAKAVQTGAVAVRFCHTGTAPPSIGDWTLKLLKNGVQVATFSVETS